VLDEDGAVVEINAAFTDIMGFGPEELPYSPARPWWPDEKDDPEGHQMLSEGLKRLMADSKGSFTVPLIRRDGRRIWVSGSFNEVRARKTTAAWSWGPSATSRPSTTPCSARRQWPRWAWCCREPGAPPRSCRRRWGELQRLWRAREVTAATWTGAGQVTVASTGPAASWDALPGALRDALAGLRDQPPLTPTAGAPGGAGIRLEHPAGTLGIWIELGSGRVLTAEDRTLLSLVCGYLGQVLHRAYQTDQQRETALALQRAILGPSRLPAGFAVRYEPATRPLEVGGDWYDIVELPDGRIGIVVGDCVGHDLGAATVMGQLRSACRALLLQDASASQALTAMDRFASFVPGAECATVFCGILDPATGSLRYSSAAHPPGIVILPGGRVVLLDGARSLPLAIRQDAGRIDADYVLPPRSTLLLYTDGLVERRGQPLTEGIARRGRPCTRPAGIRWRNSPARS
jgi:PAS domain S-box